MSKKNRRECCPFWEVGEHSLPLGLLSINLNAKQQLLPLGSNFWSWSQSWMANLCSTFHLKWWSQMMTPWFHDPWNHQHSPNVHEMCLKKFGAGSLPQIHWMISMFPYVSRKDENKFVAYTWVPMGCPWGTPSPCYPSGAVVDSPTTQAVFPLPDVPQGRRIDAGTPWADFGEQPPSNRPGCGKIPRYPELTLGITHRIHVCYTC